MAEAYIVEAVRTPVGRRKGGLSAAHPADLGAHVITALVERTGVDPSAVDDVVFGCLDTVGPQAGDIARTAWLAAGLPEEVPGTTVDRQCGSSQQAVHFAAQGVLSGTQDLVVAGGTQNMSMIPIAFASRQAAEPLGLTDGPYAGSEGWRARYGDAPVNQFHGAELIAAQWGITREDMEHFALRSHQRAVRALDVGRFVRETVAYGDVTADEGPRRDGNDRRNADEGRSSVHADFRNSRVGQKEGQHGAAQRAQAASDGVIHPFHRAALTPTAFCPACPPFWDRPSASFPSCR